MSYKTPNIALYKGTRLSLEEQGSTQFFSEFPSCIHELKIYYKNKERE